VVSNQWATARNLTPLNVVPDHGDHVSAVVFSIRVVGLDGIAHVEAENPRLCCQSCPVGGGVPGIRCFALGVQQVAEAAYVDAVGNPVAVVEQDEFIQVYMGQENCIYPGNPADGKGVVRQAKAGEFQPVKGLAVLPPADISDKARIVFDGKRYGTG